MSLPEKVVKLKKMSLTEIGHRVRAGFWVRSQRIIAKQNGKVSRQTDLLNRLNYDLPGLAKAKEAYKIGHKADACRLFLKHLAARTAPRFYIDSKEREGLKSLFIQLDSQFLEKTRKKAERFRAHKFELFGKPVQYNGAVNWNQDPISGQAWPQTYFSDISIYGRGDTPDVKYTWELNRHQHFIALGKAYWLTDDESYASEIAQQIQSWTGANPYLIGVNWTSALEVGLRTISWLWAYFFCRQSRSFDEKILWLILSSFCNHGCYLYNRLSHYVSGYNHLIGEATALFMLGSLFPEFMNAEKWRERGWKVLVNELPGQFHIDGMSVEQASTYHHFTLGFYLLALTLRIRNDETVDRNVLQRVENALHFSMHLTRPDGTVPIIGDNDSGKSIALSDHLQNDFRHYLGLGAVLFNRPDFKAMLKTCPEEVLWILGPAGFNQYDLLPITHPPKKSSSFQHSGYFIMRTGGSANDHFLCFDCGRQSAGLHPDRTPSTAHGHPDALSFELSACGRPIIIDPGMLTYNGSPEWRDYFRSTAAHNTLVVDDQSQSNLSGRLAYTHVRPPKQGLWLTEEAFDYCEGSHSGFCQGRVMHKRAIFFAKPDYWLIADHLIGTNRHKSEVFFHFAPEVCLQMDATGRALVASNETSKLLIIPLSSQDWQTEILPQTNRPNGGWVAVGYDQKFPAPIAKFHFVGNAPYNLLTLLVPFRGKPPKLNPLEFQDKSISRDCGFQIGLALKHPRFSDRILINTGDKETAVFSDVKTDARVTFIRQTAGKPYALVHLARASFFAISGKPIWNGEIPQERHHLTIACEP